MNRYDLSVIIPARNEMFLKKTIEDILEHKEGKTQIIVGLDGCWPVEGIEDHPDVVIVHYSESIGQRAITNQCIKLSRAKWVMKVDAHCAFDKGFDVKMMADMQDNWTMIPVMRNLHAFNWVCPDGHKRYQGPSGVCEKCGRKQKWILSGLQKTIHNQLHIDLIKIYISSIGAIGVINSKAT